MTSSGSGHTHSDRQRYDMACRVTRLLALNVAENVGVPFLYTACSPGNDFELIVMVKMETTHPVEGYFGSDFRAICNHCGVMVAWSHKT